MGIFELYLSFREKQYLWLEILKVKMNLTSNIIEVVWFSIALSAKNPPRDPIERRLFLRNQFECYVSG